jgi:predicted nucleotidyltransferase
MYAENVNYLHKYKFLIKIKNLPFVEKVILFGSRARGTQLSRSDIDLAILCPTATQNQWHQILDIVEKADTLLLIDCLNFDTIDHEFKERILTDGVIL